MSQSLVIKEGRGRCWGGGGCSDFNRLLAVTRQEICSPGQGHQEQPPGAVDPPGWGGRGDAQVAGRRGDVGASGGQDVPLMQWNTGKPTFLIQSRLLRRPDRLTPFPVSCFRTGFHNNSNTDNNKHQLLSQLLCMVPVFPVKKKTTSVLTHGISQAPSGSSWLP